MTPYPGDFECPGKRKGGFHSGPVASAQTETKSKDRKSDMWRTRKKLPRSRRENESLSDVSPQDLGGRSEVKQVLG
ncbi:hypothetical protein JTE90_016167 [Oedothorax gibbosus]|uniref:Uncharacterized protein n=1 Tax=Oedothorax gibbosus TaxID=931172 RepID=A0AAV6USI4_9ARAC|nr:hypothetical protein JTE90_016167 [Oedothorax gibbosus]